MASLGVTALCHSPPEPRAKLARPHHHHAENKHVLVLVALWFGLQLIMTLLQSINQLVSSLQSDLVSNHVSVRLMEKANTRSSGRSMN
jgi:hypothetical protein